MEVIEIKNRRNGEVLYSGEHESVKEAVEAAVKSGASLARAYLARAYLAGANLVDAYLAGAKVGDGDDESALEGEQANIHAQHYLDALAFAKRLLKDQADEKL